MNEMAAEAFRLRAEAERLRLERMSRGRCGALVKPSTRAKNHPPQCSRKAVKDGLCRQHGGKQ